MNIDFIKEIIERSPNLSTALGMNFISTPDDDMVMATMVVDERNRQPFGFLSGGASLALAENLAGVGSSALCPGKICVGISVSGTHFNRHGNQLYHHRQKQMTWVLSLFSDYHMKNNANS